MNKKIYILIVCVVICIIFTGCENKETDSNVLKSLTSEEVENISLDKVDVDLTELSSTMVYSEVYNMIVNPKDYIGKVVKMKGQYAQYSNQDNTIFYPAIIVADATACCSQGLEFVLDGNPSIDAYPEVDSETTVVGVFNTYLEDGIIYIHLEKAKLE